MKNWLVLAAAACLLLPTLVLGESQLSIDAPEIILTNVPFEATVTDADATVTVDGQESTGDQQFVVESTGIVTIEASHGGIVVASKEVRVIPGWTSILPPFVAILLAFLAREQDGDERRQY